MLRAVAGLLRSGGLAGVAGAAWRRLRPTRLAAFGELRPSFQARVGLELGGPSPLFGPRGAIPVYPQAARIDNGNFAAHTVWEGAITAGDSFVFNPAVAPGRQFVCEAGSLEFIADGTYDFVLSSHCLEHLANPLPSLAEWGRVLKDDGLLVLVVPHKDGTFDHRRPTTTLGHMIEDRDRRVDEGDLTHLEEILRLHDLARDPGAGDARAFAERSRDNLRNRCLHHHVFDTRSTVGVVAHLGLQILAVQAFRPFHIAVIARKPAPGASVDNTRFTDAAAAPAWRSPFPSDRGAR